MVVIGRVTEWIAFPIETLLPGMWLIEGSLVGNVVFVL